MFDFQNKHRLFIVPRNHLGGDLQRYLPMIFIDLPAIHIEIELHLRFGLLWSDEDLRSKRVFKERSLIYIFCIRNSGRGLASGLPLFSAIVYLVGCWLSERLHMFDFSCLPRH